MILVELDKYAEENNYKQPANNPTAASPDNITHARLYYNTFAGSNYIQGSFVSGSNSTVEFDNENVNYTLFKLFVSSDGSVYTERKSYGGSQGRDEVTSQQVIDAATYNDWDLPTKVTVGGVEQFVNKSLSEVITGAGITITADAVDYYYVRGIISQNNSVENGKAFFGVTNVDADTGVVSSSIIAPVISIADSFSRPLSAKVSTGKYYLQFRTDSANGFREELAGVFAYRFDSFVRPLYKKRTTSSEQLYEIQSGYGAARTDINIILGTDTAFTSELTVGDTLRLPGGDSVIASIASDTSLTLSFPLTGSNNPAGINITGTITTVNGSPAIVGSGTHFTDLQVGSAIGSANITGAILSITDDTHITLNTNATGSASGTAYFYALNTDIDKKLTGQFHYTTEQETELIGYLMLDVDSDEGTTYYQDGRLLIKTYNTDQVLTDNLLESGFTIELKAMLI